jgi:hypothetical protein
LEAEMTEYERGWTECAKLLALFLEKAVELEKINEDSHYNRIDWPPTIESIRNWKPPAFDPK